MLTALLLARVLYLLFRSSPDHRKNMSAQNVARLNDGVGNFLDGKLTVTNILNGLMHLKVKLSVHPVRMGQARRDFPAR
jgi:hypothetical protein